MKRLFVILIVALFASIPGQAQTYNYARLLGGNAGDSFVQGTVMASNGDIFIKGVYDGAQTIDGTLFRTTAHDAFVARLTSSGKIVWYKDVGFAQAEDADFAMGDIAIDASDNIYIIGGFAGDAVIEGTTLTNQDNGGTSWDVYVIKYDSNGNFIWATSFGGSGMDYGYTLTTDASGNVYVGGRTRSDPVVFGGSNYSHGGISAGFYAKLLPDGTQDWMVLMPTSGASNSGIYDLAFSDASNSLFVGGQDGGYPLYRSVSPLFGITTWTQTVTGAATGAVYGIDFLGTNLYMTGYHQGGSIIFPGGASIINNGGRDVFLVAVDTISGNEQMSTGIGGSTDEEAYALAIKNNSVLIAGKYNSIDFMFAGTSIGVPGTQSSPFLAATDLSGTELAGAAITTTTKGLATGLAVDPASNNVFISGYYIDGISFDNIKYYYQKDFTFFLHLFQFDENGPSLIPDLPITADKGEVLIDQMALDQSDNVFVAGKLDGTVWVDGTVLSSAEIDDDPLFNPKGDLVVAKFDGSGTLQWASVITSQGYDFVKDITTDGRGSVYLLAQISSQPTVNGTPLTTSDVGEVIFKFDGTTGNLLYSYPMALPVGSATNAIQGNNDPGSEVLYIGGTYTGTADFQGTAIGPATNNDFFLVAVDASGNIIPSLVFTDSGGENDDEITALDKVPNGPLMAAGNSNSVNLSFGGFDLSGNASDGNDIFIIRADVDAVNNVFDVVDGIRDGGAEDQVVNFLAVSDQAVFVAGDLLLNGTFSGTTLNNEPSGGSQFLVAYGLSGGFLNGLMFAKEMYSSPDPSFYIKNIAIDGNSYFYAIGDHRDVLPINIGTASLVKSGDSDAFLVSLTQTGAVSYATVLGGNYSVGSEGYYGTDWGADLAVNSLGEVWLTGGLAVTGYSFGSFNLQPASSEAPNYKKGSDSYLVKTAPDGATAATAQIYWTESLNSSIRQADLDGTNPQSILSTSFEPKGIAVDTLNNQLYWSNNNGRILRADISAGSLLNETIVIDESGVLLNRLNLDIELDIPNNRIYWVSNWDGSIKTADLSAADPNTTVQVLVSGLPNPRGLALDPANGILYYSTNDTTGAKDNVAAINQINTDGSGNFFLYSSQANGINYMYNDLELDTSTGILYWSAAEDDMQNVGHILYGLVADLAGTITTITSYGETWGLELDVDNNTMYWIDRGIVSFEPPRLISSALDGTAQTVLLSGSPDLGDPGFLALVLPTTGATVCASPPTANAGTDQVICEGDTVALSGTIGGAATSSTWSTNGDGTFDDATLLNAVYTPGTNDISNGTVTLTLTTDDPDGTGPCTAATDQLVITLETPPTVNVGADQNICPADVVTLNATITGPVVSATWSTSGDGSFADQAAASTTYTPGTADIASGVVTLSYTVTSGSCPAVADVLVVAISQPITAADQAASVQVQVATNIDVTTGGTFNTGDVLTITITGSPQKGTATVNNDGTITYTANSGTVGSDNIAYQVCNQCNQCDNAVAVITILNDPPAGNIPPATTIAGKPVTIDVLNRIVDINNNIDLSSLRVVVPPASGADAYFDSNNNLVVDYTGVTFVGTDELTIEVCDTDGLCTTFVIQIEVAAPGVTVFNAVSPNGDGKHDFLYIENAEFFPDNQVRIMNRWGTVVFEVKGYNNSSVVFDGRANKNGSGELPAGTYYYHITLGDATGSTYEGFFVLRR